MHGSVWEWVQDWYGADYYQRRPNPDRDPPGPETGERRVLRGGSWRNLPQDARASVRNRVEPGYRLVHFGFRCAR
jgi:formylglycine-generating enzyme required for sulfatase activity